ncbi:MAG: class I SAM-dependent methyltransferase [Deltaproteobacteria bacterium]|nr:class I SAM-dependent methyltransferase [Deltaproteobacteria bacterium]
MEKACRICQNKKDNRKHVFREKYFGTNDEFDYIECSVCGTLHIKETSKELGKYYRGTYCPHSNQLTARESMVTKLSKWLAEKGELTSDICHTILNPFISVDLGLEAFFRLSPSPFPAMRILDVGCGNGTYVKRLRISGFGNAFGIDPFLPEYLLQDADHAFQRSEISQMDDNQHYDIIIFNHSFEHLALPQNALHHAKRLLADNGQIIMRIPLAGSQAWSIFGKEWVQLDAPRHLFLHSIKGINLIANRAGLKIRKIRYDSSGFQFWGSRLYCQGKSLISGAQHRSIIRFMMQLPARQFDELRALYYNRRGLGDQVCLYLAAQ